VDWRYLEGALLKMGFDINWVKVVMKCVTYVSFLVKINGELTNKFKPSRGLRQGDPLSPYLFLFVAEGMTKILDRVVYMQDMNSLKIYRTTPSVSHLLFADDSLLFFEANYQPAGVIKEALKLYEKCTGQLISEGKCSILFSSIFPISTPTQIKNLLSIHHNNFEEKYLGFPTQKVE
jgi:hypothetical protein